MARTCGIASGHYDDDGVPKDEVCAHSATCDRILCLDEAVEHIFPLVISDSCYDTTERSDSVVSKIYETPYDP